MQRAPLLIVALSHRQAYLDRYAEADKGWTDKDEARWPVPYWHIDTGFAALLMLLTVVDEELGACFFGVPPERIAGRSAPPSGCPTPTRRSAPCRSAIRRRTGARRRCAAATVRSRRSCTAAPGEAGAGLTARATG